MTKWEDLTQEATELITYTENNFELHTRQEIPIIRNLLRKIEKGIYDSKKAEVLVKYLFDNGSRKYYSEFRHAFTPDTRREAAAYWVQEFNPADYIDSYQYSDIDEDYINRFMQKNRF